MSDRRKKVEELMEGFMSFKHRAVLNTKATKVAPRITPAQWGVVMFMCSHGSCTVKDIAKALSVTSSAATQLVDGLVSSGYVRRKQDPHDRRAVSLTLSKHICEHMTAMKRMASREFTRLFEALTDREFEQYCTLNRKIVQGFSRGVNARS